MTDEEFERRLAASRQAIPAARSGRVYPPRQWVSLTPDQLAAARAALDQSGGRSAAPSLAGDRRALTRDQLSRARRGAAHDDRVDRRAGAGA
jgi:hypothetical protein